MTSRAAVMACALCMAIVSQSTIESSNQQSSIRNKSALRNPQSAISKWRVLFDGKSLDAWRGYKNDPVPKGWVIENGTLAKHERVADIVSKDEFGDFELMIDWKIGEAGNSGIFYRDRKSTRLNSSHGYISYAVFCLKKKKNTTSSVTNNTVR